MILLMLLASLCSARLVNVTIDAVSGDAQTGRKPQYMPESLWKPLGDSKSLFGVMYIADLDYQANISLVFNGSLIYTFFSFMVLGPPLNFFLDGGSEPYAMSPQASAPAGFRGTPFKSNILSNNEHSLLVVIPQPRSLFVFGGAIYSTEEEDISNSAQHTSTTADGSHPTTALIDGTTIVSATPSPQPHSSQARQRPPSHSRVPVAVGVSLSGGITAIAFAVWFLRRRRRRSLAGLRISESQEDPARSPTVTPFYDQPNPALALPEPKNTHFLDAKEPDATASVPFVTQPNPSTSTPAALTTNNSPGLEAVRGESAVSRGPLWQSLSAGTTETSPAEPDSTPRADDTAYIYIRAELERVLAENELLRRVAEPPPYSSGASLPPSSS